MPAELSYPGVYVEEILGPGRARSIGPLPDRPAAQALIERLRAVIDGVIARSQQEIRPLSPAGAPAST